VKVFVIQADSQDVQKEIAVLYGTPGAESCVGVKIIAQGNAWDVFKACLYALTSEELDSEGFDMNILAAKLLAGMTDDDTKAMQTAVREGAAKAEADVVYAPFGSDDDLDDGEDTCLEVTVPHPECPGGPVS
jgi:hypothetical protein